MTTPNTPNAISMADINSELDLLTPAINIDLKADLYNTANSGGGLGLMYHNLSMATNNTTSAKVAIYDPYNANQNMTMSNWYNYTRNTGMVMTYLITNSSAYNVDISLVIWDTNDSAQGTIFQGVVNASSNTGTVTVNTGLLTLSGVMSSGYRIAIQNVVFAPGPSPIPPAPPVIPPVTYSVTITVDSASDTDGVGAGTTRTTYGPFSYSETQNQPPAPPPPPSPFTASKAVDTSGSLIFVNKRTTVSITIS